MDHQTARNEIWECVALARNLYGFDQRVSIRIERMGRTAGQALREAYYNYYTLRLNEQLLQSQYNDNRKNTIAHEVAHLVCFARPELGKGHNAGWKRVCIALGGDGTRTHSMPLEKVRRTRRAIYQCGEYQVKLGLTQHKRLQSGQYRWFRHRTEGFDIKPEHFTGKIVMA